MGSAVSVSEVWYHLKTKGSFSGAFRCRFGHVACGPLVAYTHGMPHVSVTLKLLETLFYLHLYPGYQPVDLWASSTPIINIFYEYAVNRLVFITALILFNWYARAPSVWGVVLVLALLYFFRGNTLKVTAEIREERDASFRDVLASLQRQIKKQEKQIQLQQMRSKGDTKID